MHRAFSIFRDSLGNEHPNTITAEQNYRLLVDSME